MKKESKKSFYIGASSITIFVLWTLLISFIDVKEIGPQNSSVGFAKINGFIHNLTGVNMNLYTITDWLGLVPFVFSVGFGIFGLMQWIKRKSILKVDFSILTLGGFYIVTMALYLLFERVVVNYRPVLIGGILEASYPSSTTMLVMCVMPTAIMQFNTRIKNNLFRKFVNFIIIAFIAFMVVGRFISGVHWFTDIVGGAFLSIGLVMMYNYIIKMHNS